VNVTNLMLLRGAGRRREMAVRQALGASARDLARAHLVESFVLAALGGIAAVFVAAWATEAIRATLLPTLAAPDALLSTRLIGITLAVTLAAGVGSSIVPAWRAARASAIPDLKQGAAGRGTGAVPNALLVAQGSLCMMLLVAAALFVQSLHRVRTQDFGFTSAGVLLAELRFAGSMNGADQDAVYRRAEEQLQRLPGVSVATVIQAAPFLGHNVPPIAVPDREDFPDLTQQAPFLTATTPTYFAALGMQLRHGRNFTAADRDGTPLVIIINQAMADGLWPNQDPLGKCIKAGFVPGEMPTGIHGSPLLPCRTVVGVVNNARPRSIREEAGQARMQYYIPFGQVPRPHFIGDHPSIWGLLIRTADAAGMAQPVQRALQSRLSNVQLADVRPLQDVLDRQMRPWLLGATMFSIFGALALGLAAVGLYGVRGYAVAQRTREIGIRMALGARLPTVVRMVLWEGVRVTAIGVAIGAAVALAASRLIDPLLFNASASDPRVHVVIGLALVIVAILASAVPAWRAARVDPNVALRAE
jgi:predicted permease